MMLPEWRQVKAVLRGNLRLPLGRALPRLWYALKMLAKVQFVRRDEGDAQVCIAACRSCALYNHHLDTCGTPGTLDADGDPVGCWCVIRIASRTPGKNCWLAEAFEDEPGRWPHCKDLKKTS